MKNTTTINLRKLFKQLQQIKTTKIYILFSFQILHINFNRYECEGCELS